MALAPITNIERVQAQLATDMTDAEPVDVASMEAAVTSANNLIYGYLMRSDVAGFAEWAFEQVAEIATRVAIRVYKNPREQSSYSYGDTTITVASPRIFTGDEEKALAPYKNTVRGPIMLQPREPDELEDILSWVRSDWE